MQQEPKPTKDEHAVYGGCVANRIRKIKNPMRLCIVKNKIIYFLKLKWKSKKTFLKNLGEKKKTSEQPGTSGETGEVEDIGNISSLIASSMNTVSVYFDNL